METKDFLADDELDSEEEEQLHQSFTFLSFFKWRTTISHPNNYVSLDDGSIVAIEKIVEMQDGSFAILGRTFDQVQPLLNSPCDSNDIFSVKKVSLLSPISFVWSIHGL